ncbi:hypothetical protein ACIPZ8_19290 [Pseudomonas sp. NPDC089422]|uniref:hypothetical protein n=1 Tax=Pseudomonas sp. NPDC089422 TaxID=3364466 RepID=UPI00381E0B83
MGERFKLMNLHDLHNSGNTALLFAPKCGRKSVRHYTSTHIDDSGSTVVGNTLTFMAAFCFSQTIEAGTPSDNSRPVFSALSDLWQQAL